nr:M24 family metallopeptidase [Pseudaminobacter soli]
MTRQWKPGPTFDNVTEVTRRLSLKDKDGAAADHVPHVRRRVGGVAAARTAVIGEPTKLQAERYAALLEGLDVTIDAMKPGVRARDVFDSGVTAVEAKGFRPYRRQHIGHAIGMAVYEAPVIMPESSDILQAGSTFCLETPYYEPGWGGMMVEDTGLLADNGFELLSTIDRYRPSLDVRRYVEEWRDRDLSRCRSQCQLSGSGRCNFTTDIGALRSTNALAREVAYWSALRARIRLPVCSCGQELRDATCRHCWWQRRVPATAGLVDLIKEGRPHRASA